MRTILTITAACLLLGACDYPHAETDITPDAFSITEHACHLGRAVYTTRQGDLAVVDHAPECAPLKPSVE